MPDRRGGGSTEVAAERRVRTTVAPPYLPTSVLPVWLPVALVLLAIPLMRPNILGEQGRSIASFGLFVAAALVALLRRRGSDVFVASAPRSLAGRGSVLIVFLFLGYLYILFREATTVGGDPATATFQGIFLTVGSLVALEIVCKDPHTGRAVGRGVVIMTTGFCASYGITILVWAATGVGSGQILTMPVGSWGLQPVYLPFTATVSFQPVFGLVVPRFTGLGREPGWMAMYCAAAFFLADMLKMRSRWIKPLLLLGLLGCVSTAGFGVFVVTWAYHRFLRDRGGISMTNYLRQVGGLAMMGLAVWVAVAAPVFGLAAKSSQNAASLDERSAATNAGVELLFSDPWGGHYQIVQGGINLVSDVAVSGLPFVILVIVGLLLTITSSGRKQDSNAVALVVLLTLLSSQPPKDSTWAYGLVVLACALRRPDGGTPSPIEVAPPIRKSIRESP